MVNFGQRLSTFLIIFIILTIADVRSENDCKCLTDENFRNSENHLKLIAKITSLKVLPFIRDIIYQADREKFFVLQKVRNELSISLKTRYGNRINQSEIMENFDELMKKVEKSMKLALSEKDDDNDTHENVNDFYKNILPSTFLCVVLGECSSKMHIKSYKECMLSHSSQFQNHFGKEKDKIIHSIINGIAKFKAFERELENIQSLLLQSQSNVQMSCLEDYIKIFQCSECVADRIAYCRNSCEHISQSCFSTLNLHLNNQLNILEETHNIYENAFKDIRKAFLTDLSYLVERSSPSLARQVVQICGRIITDDENVLEEAPLAFSSSSSLSPSSSSSSTKNVSFQMKEMVKQILKYKNYWKIVANRVCSQPSSDHFCWNGTNIVRNVEANGLSVDEPSILKNVRPKPKIPEEGSASPWLDDEDFAGSGNGSGNEPIDDDVDVIVTARPPNFLTSAGPTSPAFNRNHVAVTEMPGGSSNFATYFSSLLILLISRQLF